jgi:hypothetical protein
MSDMSSDYEDNTPDDLPSPEDGHLENLEIGEAPPVGVEAEGVRFTADYDDPNS